MRICLIILSLLFAGAALAAPKRVAVLPLQNSAGVSGGEIRYLTNLVRKGAMRTLNANHFTVMTEENMEAMLPPGKTLADCVAKATCAVDIGKEMKAHYVVTGELVRFGTSLRLSVKVHVTSTKGFLEQIDAKGQGVEAFESALETQTPVLFAAIKKHSGGGGAPTLGAGANVSANNAAPQAVDFDLPGAGASKMALMGFESTPPGAMVMIDGTARCETPCSKKVTQGRHQIAMTKLGYVQHAEAVAVSSSQTLRWTLVRDAGTLKLTSTSNHTLRVEGPDGPVEAPATTPATLEVAPGVYTVSVGDSKCFVPHTQTLVVKRGETTPATFTPAVLPAGLKVEMVDGKGSDLEADVYADGVKVGDTMAPFKLPVCSTNVEVRPALHAPVKVVNQLVAKTLTTVKLTTGGVTISDENIRFQKSCDGGDMDGCFNLGYNYNHGIGVPKDPRKANALYKKACDGGDMGGCNNLGYNYQKGMGVPKDPRKGNALYKRACDGGDMGGCTNLGVNYVNGTGVPKDPRKANALFKKACDGGHMNGCANLGYSYVHGRGVSPDRSKGRRLLQRACDGGSKWACGQL